MYQWTSTSERLKERWRSIAVGHVVLLGLILLTASARGQTKADITNKPPPPPTNAAPIGVPTDPLGFPGGPSKRSGRVPPSSVVELKSSLAELKENVRLLEVINQELQAAVSSPSGPDYPIVINDAKDINKLAIRIMRNLTLRPADSPAASETQSPARSVEELKASIAALDGTVQTLLNDSLPAEPRTVDAGQLNKAGANLETMVRLSVVVREDAEDLATVGGKSAKSEHPKTRLKPSTTIQLSAECNAWSMADLLKRSAQTKGHESVNVGVEAQSRRQQLAETAILPIDDCVDGATYEKGIADNVQYVAIVTDFTSYEVKGRVFAYRVPYKIGLSKNGKVEKRFDQIVSFYYVDEAGDGAFELLTGPVAFGLVPDWVKDLAEKH
jgi:hypothetical protein